MHIIAGVEPDAIQSSDYKLAVDNHTYSDCLNADGPECYGR